MGRPFLNRREPFGWPVFEEEHAMTDEKPDMQEEEKDMACEVDGQSEADVDAVTGASPGTAQACSDLGLNDLEANLARFNIKPPGVS